MSGMTTISGRPAVIARPGPEWSSRPRRRWCRGADKAPDSGGEERRRVSGGEQHPEVGQTGQRRGAHGQRDQPRLESVRGHDPDAVGGAEPQRARSRTENSVAAPSTPDAPESFARRHCRGPPTALGHLTRGRRGPDAYVDQMLVSGRERRAIEVVTTTRLAAAVRARAANRDSPSALGDLAAHAPDLPIGTAAADPRAGGPQRPARGCHPGETSRTRLDRGAGAGHPRQGLAPHSLQYLAQVVEVRLPRRRRRPARRRGRSCRNGRPTVRTPGR